MASELSEARRAVTRGRADEALVHLWNALEPARLAADSAELRRIGGLAERVREVGDEGERREAERLLEALRSAFEDEREPEATVALPGENGDGGLLPEDEVAAEVEEEQSGPGARFAQLLIPLIILVIVIINVLAGLFGDGE
jgi:hypothetical protein